jgi:hypothetical protein
MKTPCLPLYQTGYYTVVIPWVPFPRRTEWHPTVAVGPFSSLTRGAFRTMQQAFEWASSHLGKPPYEVKWIPGVEEDQ